VVVVKAVAEPPIMHILDAVVDVLKGEKNVEIEIKKRVD
jgi:hypothetical protein